MFALDGAIHDIGKEMLADLPTDLALRHGPQVVCLALHSNGFNYASYVKPLIRFERVFYRVCCKIMR